MTFMIRTRETGLTRSGALSVGWWRKWFALIRVSTALVATVITVPGCYGLTVRVTVRVFAMYGKGLAVWIAIVV